MSAYLRTVLALTTAYVKRTSRDKAALFFSFLFPLLFLLVFGSLNRGNTMEFDVAVLNRSETPFAAEFAKQLGDLEVLEQAEQVTDLEAARQLMGAGELDAVIELPASFGELNAQGQPAGAAVVYFEEASPQGGQTVAAVVQSTFDALNQQLLGATFPLSVTLQSTATNNLSSFDYVFAGLLGFALLSLGVFGMAQSFPAEKKTGAFRRLQVSPVRPSQLVLANAANYLLTGVISVALMTVAALVIFDFQMQGDYLSYALFCIFGIITMFGFGLAIGAWAENENQAAPLSNLVAFPLMFLSGVFFPRFLMPDWLQSLTNYLPLTPIIDGLRMITAEGKTVFELGPQLLLMLGWVVLVYGLAIRLFRWK